MKKFSELVKKYTALAGTKAMAQWCVSMGLDMHLHNKRVAAIIKQQQNK